MDAERAEPRPPFRPASVPGDVDAFTRPGMDARPHGPMDAAAGGPSYLTLRSSSLGSRPSSWSAGRPAAPIVSSPAKIATASIDLRPCLSQ